MISNLIPLVNRICTEHYCKSKLKTLEVKYETTINKNTMQGCTSVTRQVCAVTKILNYKMKRK